MQIHYYKKLLICLCLMVFSGVLFAENKTIIVSPDHPGFTIKLSSNRTTGYSWVLKNYDNKLLTLLSHQYVKPNSVLSGAPGYEEWRFKANSSYFEANKTTTVSLSYVRPWEQNTPTTNMVYEIKPALK